MIGDLEIEEILFNSLAHFKYLLKFRIKRNIKKIINIVKIGKMMAMIIIFFFFYFSFFKIILIFKNYYYFFSFYFTMTIMDTKRTIHWVRVKGSKKSASFWSLLVLFKIYPDGVISNQALNKFYKLLHKILSNFLNIIIFYQIKRLL